MTPYTIRERRANIATHGPDAYPGQKEKLLADLIESDRQRSAAERDRAVEARYGGRLYRVFANDPRYRPIDGWVASYVREIAR